MCRPHWRGGRRGSRGSRGGGNPMVRRALSYFRPELPRVIASFLMVALGPFLSSAWPLPLALLIDLFAPTASREWWVHRLWDTVRPDTFPGQILLLTGITLAIRLLKELLQMQQTLLNIQIGYHGLMHVRCDLFRKLQELSV